MTYEEYEKECTKIKKDNEVFLEMFRLELESKGLSEKVINGHVSNVDFFLNDYNIREEADPMEAGCSKLDDYFGYFFIRKCMWSTPTSIKSSAASFKKFYKCMLANNKIDIEDYETVTESIKENLESWVEDCAQFNDNE